MDFDNIGDFLYIILLVVFSIIGAVTRKKKKPLNTEREPQKNIFETLFGEEELKPYFETDETRTIPEPKIIKEIKPEPPKQSRYNTLERVGLTKKSRLNTEDEHGDTVQEYNPIFDGEIGNESSAVKLDLSDDEEIKKGIIYSEILKPKYVNW